MGCRHEWADEDRLIKHLYLESPWTWDEYDQAAKDAYAELRAENRPVATVVDVSRMGRLPSGNVIAHLNMVERLIPDNMFITVLVGAPHIATVFMNIMMKLRPKAKNLTVFADSIAEAHELVYKRYRELYPDAAGSAASKPDKAVTQSSKGN